LKTIFVHSKFNDMAKSNKKRREEAKQKREARNFLRAVLISTGAVLVLLFVMFMNS
jgi:CHASE3 domain sensor protein